MIVPVGSSRQSNTRAGIGTSRTSAFVALGGSINAQAHRVNRADRWMRPHLVYWARVVNDHATLGPFVQAIRTV